MKKYVCLLVMTLLLTGCSSAASAPEPDIEEKGPSIIEPMPDEPPVVPEVPEDAGPSYPAPLDFDSFAIFESFAYEGIPEEAEYPAASYGEGEWKYEMQFRFDDGSNFAEIGYADFILDYEQEVLILKLHPRLANDGYEVWEESDEEVGYEPFEGDFEDDGSLKYVGNNMVIIYINHYFAYEGREYMMGSIWLSEESYGDFWMYRGQD